MSYNRIAVLAALHTQLLASKPNPSRGLAELAGRLVLDDTFNKTPLHHIAERRPLAAALLWTRIADHLSGQARIESLTLAATFALAGGNPGISATLIDRIDVAARREHTQAPPLIEVLKLDHRVREHHHAVAV